MMKKLCLLILLLLMFMCYSFAQDSVVVRNGELQIQFKGVVEQQGEDTVYKGVMVDGSFVYWYGTFDKQFHKQVSFTPDLDEQGMMVWKEIDDNSYYITTLSENVFKQSDLLFEINNKGKKDDAQNNFMGRIYWPDSDKWFYGYKVNDSFHGLFIEDGETREADDGGDDKYMWWLIKYVFYFVVVWGLCAVLLKKILSWFIRENSVFWAMCLSVVLTIMLYIFLPADILYFQFLVPGTLVGLYYLSLNDRLPGRIRRYVSSSIIVLALMYVGYVNFITSDALYVDHHKININWQPGTGPLKRHLIKDELKTMNMLDVDDGKGVNGSLLIGENVIRDRTYCAVTGSPIWWILSFFNQPFKDSMTERKAIDFIVKLRAVTGIEDIDIPRHEELIKGCGLGKSSYCHGSNELTKTHIIGKRAIGNNEYIDICEKVVYVKDSGVFAQAYSSVTVFKSAFRLVYRINGFGKKKISVCGKRISDADFPEMIRVESIDGDMLNDEYWVLCMEQLIEKYYVDREMVCVDEKTGKKQNIEQTHLKSDYVFYPVFLK